MKFSAGGPGNFWLGISISRQTTLPLLVLVGLGWWVVSVRFGTPVYDVREKRRAR